MAVWLAAAIQTKRKTAVRKMQGMMVLTWPKRRSERRGEEAAGEVGCIHEDEEVHGGVAVELEVDLGVCYDEVEAEVDAPEGKEEA